MKKTVNNKIWDLDRMIILLIISLFCLLPVLGISGCDSGIGDGGYGSG